jgi:uncharacterized protein YndB with AHSA1/START domain
MRVDEATRLISAAPERVFGAFVDADDLLAWLPPGDMSGRLDWFDPVVGGGFRMLLTYRTPSGDGKFSDDSDLSEARIVELEPPERIVWAVDFPSDDPAFSGTMTMAWTFEPDGAQTRVTVRATDVPSGIDPADHAEGLSSSLTQLAELCQRNPA